MNNAIAVIGLLIAAAVPGLCQISGGETGSRIPSFVSLQTDAVESPLRATWKIRLEINYPKADQQCKWTTEYPGKLAFGRGHILVGMHADCWDSSTTPVSSLRRVDVLSLVNSDTGGALKQVSWEEIPVQRLARDSIRLFPLANGNFLVQVGTLLKVFSPDLTQVRSRDLAEPGDSGIWILNVSPNGNAAVLCHYALDDKSSFEFRRISLDTLADTYVQSAPPYIPSVAISGEETYFAAMDSSVYALGRSSIKAQRLCNSCSGIPLAVTSGGYVVVKQNRGAAFTLVSPSGELKYEGRYGSPSDSINDVAVAADSQSFAFVFGHLNNGWFSSGARYQIVVFDTAEMKRIVNLKSKGYTEKSRSIETWCRPAVALSADGSDLAVLEGPRITVLSLR